MRRLLGPVLVAALWGLGWTGRPVPRASAQPAQAAPATGGQGLMVAVYLPGLYFANLDGKAELGNEIAEHLSRSLGRPATSRIYATAEALESDAARITVALVESPYVAARPGVVVPLSVSVLNGKDDTRLVVMGGGPVREIADLREHRMAYAALPYEEQLFLDNFLFEGEMQLGRDHLEPARDAASALSKISLKKADAVLLYEGDAALGRQANLQLIYESAYLPRPTLVVFDRSMDPAQLQRLREVMSRYSGRSHPLIRAFRPALAERYQTLHAHMQRRSLRLPPLLDLLREEPPLKLPAPPSSPVPQPSLKIYAPAIDKLPLP